MNSQNVGVMVRLQVAPVVEFKRLKRLAEIARDRDSIVRMIRPSA